MAATTGKIHHDHEASLEIAVIRLAKAVDRLNGTVRQLAEKEHLDPTDREERYHSILQSVSRVSRDLQSVAEALGEDAAHEPV